MAQSFGKQRPKDNEIQDALFRILNSEVFSRSERSRELLQYIIEQELAGEGARLKGFSIAQDVFGKDVEFDPQTDAVVRVQAGRLRESMASYYDDEGANDLIRIEIPRGTYMPVYSKKEIKKNAAKSISEAAPVNDSALTNLADDHANQTIEMPRKLNAVISNSQVPVSTFVVRNLHAIWVALALIVALLCAIFYLALLEQVDGENSARVNTPSPKSAAAAVFEMSFPTIMFDGIDPEASQSARDMIGDLTNAASRFNTVHLVTQSQRRAENSKISAEFFAVFNPRENNTIDLSIVATKDNSIVWSGNVAMNGAARDEQNYALSGALTDLFTPSGRLYSYLGERGELNELGQCLWLTSSFYLGQDGQRFEDAYKCYEKLMESGELSALASADFASLMVERVNDKYSYPVTMTPEIALDRAYQSIAERVTAEGYRALGSALSLYDDDIGREEAYRNAYSLNPFNLEIAAAYGWSLLESHAFDESAIILKSALKDSTAEPGWWSYSLFISAFVSGDMETADFAVSKLAGSQRSHYLAARIIMADVTGNVPLREQLLESLRSLDNGVAKDPAEYYTRLYGAEAGAKLTAALEKAGFKPSSSTQE